MTTYRPGGTVTVGTGRAYILSVHHEARGDELVAATITPAGLGPVVNLRADDAGHLTPIHAAAHGTAR